MPVAQSTLRVNEMDMIATSRLSQAHRNSHQTNLGCLALKKVDHLYWGAQDVLEKSSRKFRKVSRVREKAI